MAMQINLQELLHFPFRLTIRAEGALPERQIAGALQQLVKKLSSVYGSGDAAMDLLLVASGCSLVALILSLLLPFLSRRTITTEGNDPEMSVRLSVLEIQIAEQKQLLLHQGSEIKATFGFLRQELGDIRNLLVSESESAPSHDVDDEELDQIPAASESRGKLSELVERIRGGTRA